MGILSGTTRYILLLLVLIQYSCQRQDEVYSTVLGRNILVPENKVYLTTMERNALILDSANVEGGIFRISIPQETSLVRACIAYRDDSGNINILRFLDPNSGHLLTEDRRYSDYFAIEAGTIYIDGTHELGDGQTYAFLRGNKENTLLFSPEFHLLNTLEDNLIENYDETIRKLVGLIKADSFSTSSLVLERICNYRNLLSKNDLQHIVSQIDLASDSSFYVKYLHQYLNRLPANFNPKEKFGLSDGNGGEVTDYDQKKALNMMIFSTTWSYHSSLLLYYLKKEQEDFGYPNLYMVDIGLDEKEDWWKSKLIKSHEKKWDQLYAPRALRTDVLFRYKITKLPIIVFTDQKGREIYRIEKYDDQTIARSRDFIQQFFVSSPVTNYSFKSEKSL